jgi:uncharacterized protein
MSQPPFHLAFPVHDLDAARAFYVGLLGATEGRSDPRWVDFDLRGHQITAHLVDALQAVEPPTNPVDGEDIPVPHFGLVLGWEAWHRERDRLEAAGADFLVAPTIRFPGRPGEQATLFLRDPSGNAVELKAMRDPARLFASS